MSRIDIVKLTIISMILSSIAGLASIVFHIYPLAVAFNVTTFALLTVNFFILLKLLVIYAYKRDLGEEEKRRIEQLIEKLFISMLIVLILTLVEVNINVSGLRHYLDVVNHTLFPSIRSL